MSPYRAPSWPRRPPRPRPRRFTPARTITPLQALLLTATTYLLLGTLFVLHPLTLAMLMKLRMPFDCGCMVLR